jgi:DNA-binding transcriptional ArsR family regulator
MSEDRLADASLTDTRRTDIGLTDTRLTGTQLRALAHPLRARLLGALRVESPQTATGLAAKLGTNSGATSYHLRQLAAAGMVTEAAGHGQGRERWWRAAHRSHSWVDSDFADDPDEQAAVDWLSGFYLRHFSERAHTWLARRREWSPEWRDAAALSDYLLELNPEQLADLNRDLEGVIERHQSREPGPDAVPVSYYLYGFPRIESS